MTCVYEAFICKYHKASKQASPTKSPFFFFHSPNAVMNIFCLRTCGQPENKVTETEKGAKIAPIVLPSTARFICFNIEIKLYKFKPLIAINCPTLTLLFIFLSHLPYCISQSAA